VTESFDTELSDLKKKSRMPLDLALDLALVSEPYWVKIEALGTEMAKIFLKNDFENARTSHHYTTVGRFWAEHLPKFISAVEQEDEPSLLIELLRDIPEAQARNLMSQDEQVLVEYLKFCKQEVKKARQKLSRLQKDILSSLYRESIGGILKVSWKPVEL